MKRLDALEIGRVVAELGGARQVQGQKIDRGVGVRLHTRLGDRIAAGEPLVTIFARSDEQANEATAAIEAATTITPGHASSTRKPTIIERRG